MVLYVHISSFYERRTRVSMLGATMQDRASKVPMTVNGNMTRDRMSTSQMNPPTTSAFRDVAGDIMPPPGTLHSHPNNRLSSWLIPETEQTSATQGTPRRMSLRDRLSSLVTGRGTPTRQDRAQSPLWTDTDMESGTPYVDTKTSFAVTTPSSRRVERNAMALDAPSFGFRNGGSPDGTISSFGAVENYSRNDLPPPTLPKLRGSPVYGLDGIMRYHGQPSPPSPLSRPSSVQSSGMESVLRQQAELDKSVAELQQFAFSPTSVTSGDRLTVPGGQALSIGSDFSLSIFPDPPKLPDLLADKKISDTSRVNASGDKRAQAMFPSPVTTNSQRPQSNVQREQRQSFSSSTSSSTDAAVLGVANRTILGSSGYDVTSFIGS